MGDGIFQFINLGIGIKRCIHPTDLTSHQNTSVWSSKPPLNSIMRYLAKLKPILLSCVPHWSLYVSLFLNPTVKANFVVKLISIASLIFTNKFFNLFMTDPLGLDAPFEFLKAHRCKEIQASWKYIKKKTHARVHIVITSSHRCVVRNRIQKWKKKFYWMPNLGRILQNFQDGWSLETQIMEQWNSMAQGMKQKKTIGTPVQ